jgi:citrate synthase
LSDARELLLLGATLSGIFGASANTTSLTATSIAAHLARVWKSTTTRIQPSQRARAINQALVLAVDHGLDKITVAVRMMAMAGADLHACISTGLDALAGFEYEGTCMQLEHIVGDLASPSAVRRFVAIQADRGQSIPGFGHPWYAAGDPRATSLLEQAVALAPDERRIRNVFALIDATREQGAPTFEVGLVALVAALDLPFGSAATLVALGRMAGFIAHVFEQWDSTRNS